ncbi:MAG: transglycosylase domain-containing protein [Campylobacterales bacterium]|nr:transglycosylase domain-containing protein [Campylobacterales bacterium]
MSELKDKAVDVIISPFVWLKKVVCITGSIVIAGFLAFLLFLGNFYFELPDLEKMTFKQVKEIGKSRVIKKLDNPKKNYFKWTDIKDLNRDYLYTIVMAEDSTFFTHKGINYDSLVESFIQNYRSGEYKYGASTITQQVAKNLFLSNSKSLYRKAQEFLTAKRLEERFSKNEILELYLNIAEFGPEVYGIRAASYRIFNEDPKDINAAEGAFIATLLPSPKRYYYAMVQNRNISPANKKKIIRILKDMRYNEFISNKQFLQYKKYNYFKQ